MRVAPAAGLAIVLMACTPTPPVSPAPSLGAASIAPTPAATSLAAPTSELGGWRKVTTTDALGAGPSAVAWFKDRWVAVGVDRPGKRWRPLTWWSADGANWSAGQLGSVPGGDVSSALVGLVVQGDVLVAYGWSSSQLDLGAVVDLANAGGGAATGNVVAAVARGPARAKLAAQCVSSLRSANALVMTSTDGATWTTVPDQPSLRGQPMLGTVAWNGSLVAVGGADGIGRSAAWTSPDGQRWTRAPGSPALNAGAMQGVIAVGGTLLAWGFYLDEEICPAPMLWRSSDGVGWSTVDDAVGLQSLWRSMSTAATATVGLTVVGTGAGQALDLTTTDGATWSAHDLPDDLAFGPVIAVPDGFLAGGTQSVWFSPDGAVWNLAATPGAQFDLLAASPTATIAVARAASVVADLFGGGNDIWLGRAGGH